MPNCEPKIEPCEHGNFKAACACGWRVHPRFRTVASAEATWAKHAQQRLGESDGS